MARLPTRSCASSPPKTKPQRPRHAHRHEAAGAEPSLLEECIAAVEEARLPRAGGRAEARRDRVSGAQGLLQRVIAPLARTIGELWRDGIITAAHEHFASAVIRIFLGHAAKPFAGDGKCARSWLWPPRPDNCTSWARCSLARRRRISAGTSPISVRACRQRRLPAPRGKTGRGAVALSLVYPEDDPRLEGELSRLRDRCLRKLHC